MSMSMSMTMTNRQRRIVVYIAAFRREHGVSPTVREIAGHLGTTTSTAQQHIDRLVREDILIRPSVPGKPGMSLPRGLRPARAVMKAETETL